MPRLEVHLPSDRKQVGEIVLRNDADEVVAGPFPARGYASFKDGNPKNPTYDPLQYGGHTPLGEYWVRDVVGSGDGTNWNKKEYGSAGVIRMSARSGQAADAVANGRWGIFIHSKDRDGGVLAGTAGCVRVREADMAKLVTAIRLMEAFEGFLQSCAVDVGNRFIVTVETQDGVGPPEPDPPIGAPDPRLPLTQPVGPNAGHPPPANPTGPSRPNPAGPPGTGAPGGAGEGHHPSPGSGRPDFPGPLRPPGGPNPGPGTPPTPPARPQPPQPPTRGPSPQPAPRPTPPTVSPPRCGGVMC